MFLTNKITYHVYCQFSHRLYIKGGQATHDTSYFFVSGLLFWSIKVNNLAYISLVCSLVLNWVWTYLDYKRVQESYVLMLALASLSSKVQLGDIKWDIKVRKQISDLSLYKALIFYLGQPS